MLGLERTLLAPSVLFQYSILHFPHVFKFRFLLCMQNSFLSKASIDFLCIDLKDVSFLQRFTIKTII